MAESSAGPYIVESAKVSLDILEDISGALPAPVGVAVKLMKRIIVAAEAVKSNRDLCDQLRDRLLRLVLVVVDLAKKGAGASADKTTLPSDLKTNLQQLQTSLETISKEVEKIQSVTTSKRKRHRAAAFFLGQSHTATLKKCSDDLDWAMREFSVSTNLADAARLWDVYIKVYEVSKDVSQMSKNVSKVAKDVSEGFQKAAVSHTMQSLPRAKYAAFDCERPDHPSSCFKGTRIAILETIFEWVLSTNPEFPRFYWMKGIAGVGKTTIARTIAELAQVEGILGGQFFFSRQGEAELRNPALVFSTIAYQLARFEPVFCERITTAIEADPDLPYAGLKQQLEGLIIDPLKDLQRDPKRVVLVVFDAFDECEAKGAKQILQLLVAAMPRLPFFLKILVTSRPEPHIQSVLAPSTNLQITALHDIEKSIVKSDIRLYLCARLRALPEERGLGLPPDWIEDAEIGILADEADTLFILAETCRRFLWDALDIRRQLDILLKIITSTGGVANATNPYAQLDKLYLEILRGMMNENNSVEVAEAHQAVIGTIVLLRDPLPVDALDRLIGPDTPKAASILPLLHSVVLPPSTTEPCPRVYHPSFPDFLQDAKRCSDERFRIDTENHETRMTLRCLELMNTQLHMSMLGDLDPALLNNEVDSLERKLQAAVPTELRYACRFWPSHLMKARAGDERIAKVLEMFAAKTLLAWIETMSWLGDTRLCSTLLAAVNMWAANSNCSSLTKTLLNDGHRTLLAHLSTISQGARHIQRSVLPFLPRHSALLSQYNQHSDPSVTILRGADLDWSACLMVLKSHADPVNSVVFSPDGSRLASGSSDKTIQIWEATTGNCLATLKGHSESVPSVSFSPDGSQLASGSWDDTVRVWDATTGVCLSTLDDHSRSVYSVSFSPDGTRLASGSIDNTIRVWDTATWNCVFVLKGHTGDVRSVAYSPDGTRLASGSKDLTVRVWDAIDGKLLATLKGHSNWVLAVVFSPTNSQLASGSLDGTIRIWDVDSSICLTTLHGHTNGVTSLSFTLDGLRLASGSWDKTIRIWDPINATCLSTFHGHSSSVNSVVVSPITSRLASASDDKTVRIWDTSASDQITDLEPHSNNITSVSFSPDGMRLAFGSTDNVAHVWNAVTGECLITLKGHSDRGTLVAFSPDGLRIASGSGGDTIQVWDSTTGDCSVVLRGHSYWVRSVVFSPDGTRLASGSFDDTVRVWDPIKGDCLAVLKGHSRQVTSVAYSPDGLRLASGSLDTTIRVWDVINGACLATLEGHSDLVLSVNFSPNGSFIISRSSNNDLLTWDALEYVQIVRSGKRSTHEAGDTHGNHLDVQAGRLVRIDPSGITHLICLLPPSFLFRSTHFVEFAPSQYRVALVHQDGSLLVLEVVLS